MRIDLVKLFSTIHDFWMNFERQLNQMLIGQRKRLPRRLPSLHPSEVITIIILFHMSGFRNFKTFYTGYVVKHLNRDFPGCTSYQRFIELKKVCVFPLYCYLISCMGNGTGISFVDSTFLQVCHPKRIENIEYFADLQSEVKLP